MRAHQRPSWFGVKTLFRVEPVGRPLGKDRLYSRNMTMVEERVVVVRARSASEALKIGETEARRYARSSHRNPYGQRVRTRRLDCIEAYDMNEPLHELTEVYSSTRVVPRRVSDRTLVRRAFGPVESHRVRASRRNILNICFSRPAPGVKLTKAEQTFHNK